MGVPESQLVDSIRSQFGDTAGDQAAQIYSSLNDVQVRPVIESMTPDAIPLSTIVPEERRLSDRKTPLGAIARAVSSPFENAPQDFDDTTAVDQIFADVQNVKTPISEGEFVAAGAMPTSMQSALLAAESPTNIRLPTKVDEDGEKIDDPLGALVADASNFHLLEFVDGKQETTPTLNLICLKACLIEELRPLAAKWGAKGLALKHCNKLLTVVMKARELIFPLSAMPKLKRKKQVLGLILLSLRR